MLEYSKNHHIFEAYKRILEAQSLPQREYAYHCTNVNPEIIKSQGFVNKDGFTLENQFQELYDKYLPDSKCFVSKTPWDENSKYIVKLDITGLKKYPDFGHLIDCGAYFDYIDEEDCTFWWEEKDIYPNPSPYVPKELADFLKNETEDLTFYSGDFDGDLSWNLIGTCCIDGKELTPDRFVEIKKIDESIQYPKKNWSKINAIRHNIKERSKMLTPSEFASCMGKKRFGGIGIDLYGDARKKILSIIGDYAFSVDITISESDDSGNVLMVDIDIEPSRDWDRTSLQMLLSYISSYAPWMHLKDSIEDQRHMFVRFEVKDPIVVNAYRKLVGKDDERTDYVQMDLFNG